MHESIHTSLNAEFHSVLHFWNRRVENVQRSSSKSLFWTLNRAFLSVPDHILSSFTLILVGLDPKNVPECDSTTWFQVLCDLELGMWLTIVENCQLPPTQSTPKSQLGMNPEFLSMNYSLYFGALCSESMSDHPVSQIATQLALRRFQSIHFGQLKHIEINTFKWIPSFWAWFFKCTLRSYTQIPAGWAQFLK